MKKTPSLVVAGLIAIFAIAETGSASAENVKLYSGYDCKASLQVPKPLPPNGLGPVIYTYGMALNNLDGSSLWLNCSITRDHGPIVRGWVSFIDVNPAVDFRCYVTVFSRIFGDERDNSLINRIPLDMETPGWPPEGLNYNSTRQVDFGGIPNTEANETDVYFLDCLVPPMYNGEKSGIVSYRVEESD